SGVVRFGERLNWRQVTGWICRFGSAAINASGSKFIQQTLEARAYLGGVVAEGAATAGAAVVVGAAAVVGTVGALACTGAAACTGARVGAVVLVRAPRSKSASSICSNAT